MIATEVITVCQLCGEETDYERNLCDDCEPLVCPCGDRKDSDEDLCPPCAFEEAENTSRSDFSDPDEEMKERRAIYYAQIRGSLE